MSRKRTSPSRERATTARHSYSNGKSYARSRDGSPAGRATAHRRGARYRSRSRSDSRAMTHRRRGSYSSRSRSRSPPRRRRRDSDVAESRHRRRGRDRSSPSRSRSRSRSAPIRSRKPLPSQLDSFRGEGTGEVAPAAKKETINWKTTGLLAAETNTVRVSASEKVVLKYNEPPEARKPPPSARWRLYIFKGDETVGDVQLSTQSCWLIGKEAAVADLVTEHPSCSKQHAVVQFRYVVKQEKDKEMGVDDFLAEFGETPVGGSTKEKGKVRP
ncbi:MAG: FHA domain-containing protein, partial [Terriglobus roseus]|nr:FHA domain-containing protein [Terriglobus roseus]